MIRKYISLVVFLCLLVMVKGAFGEEQTDVDYQDNWHDITSSPGATNVTDSNWFDPEAWGAKGNTPGTGVPHDPGPRPPDANVWAAIEAKPPGPNIVGGNAACSRLSIYPWTGGTQIGPGQSIVLTVEANATNPVNFNCGTRIGLCGLDPFDSSNYGYAVLNVYGGTMYTSLARTVDPIGLWVGGGRPPAGTGLNYGTVNMYGGNIIVNGIRINYGDVNLYGGLLYNTLAVADNNFAISTAHAMNKINIEGDGTSGGELRLKGDRRDQVDDFFRSGRICPCWGHGILYVDYNGTDTSVTAKCTPGSAWNPTPTDREERIALDSNLITWSPGNWVQDAIEPNGTHAVYLGLDFNDVNTCAAGSNASSADYSDSNLTVHIIHNGEDWNSLEIECHSTDVNSNFTTSTPLWKVREIFILHGKHYLKLKRDEKCSGDEYVVIHHSDPNVRGKRGRIRVDATDGSTTTYPQNFSSDTFLYTNIGTYKGRQDANSYTLDVPLDAGATYYWRIDEYNDVNDDSPWRGQVWRFQTRGGDAIDPVPSSGAVGLPIPLQLSWTPGVFVADTNGHDVYFGTSEADVASDTNSNLKGTYQGRQDSNVFLLSSLPTDLAADTNYYWRIDEVNGATIWGGETWMFRNTNYFIIDDFESYNSDEALLARWDMGDVYESCPYQYPSGEIGWASVSDNGTMRYDYDNYHGNVNCSSCYFSEVRFDANGEDWTGGGALPDNDKARVLAISYIGGPRNSSDNKYDPNYDKMYVAIEDTGTNFGSIILNSDPEGQRMSVQKQWKVSLTDLNSPDVNLKAVKYLYLGFGIRCNAGLQGGTGTVTFDDIRLYQRHCVPEYGPVADLSGDCRVDINDVNMFADQWLSKQTVVTPKEPCNIDPNLVLWYKFDETTLKVVTDSSGHNYNGDVNVKSGVADDSWWDTTGGYDGSGCINMILDFNTIVEANKAALGFVATKKAITFSVWVNADVYSPPDWWARLINVHQDTNSYTSYESEVVEIECPTARPPAESNGPYVRFISDPLIADEKERSEQMQMSDFGDGWHHYAFVRDADVNLMRIYHNGGVVAEVNNLITPMFGLPIESFRLGDWDRGGSPLPVGRTWIGRIDDFRVYDYALSQEEVAWLRGTGIVPFDNVANFKESSTPEVVNFGDYAILAQQWLTEPQLWP